VVFFRAPDRFYRIIQQRKLLASQASSSKSFLEASFCESFFSGTPQSGNPSTVWPSGDGCLKLSRLAQNWFLLKVD
jgi:hypothetical protein